MGTTTKASDLLTFPLQIGSSTEFWTDVCFFNGSGVQTRIEIYYSVAMEDLSFQSYNGQLKACFLFSISIYDSLDQIVFEKQINSEIVARSLAESTDETKGIESTGLGLFITKEIVERMGGKIWADSRKGKGSLFSFSLKITR